MAASQEVANVARCKSGCGTDYSIDRQPRPCSLGTAARSAGVGMSASRAPHSHAQHCRGHRPAFGCTAQLCRQHGCEGVRREPQRRLSRMSHAIFLRAQSGRLVDRRSLFRPAQLSRSDACRRCGAAGDRSGRACSGQHKAFPDHPFPVAQSGRRRRWSVSNDIWRCMLPGRLGCGDVHAVSERRLRSSRRLRRGLFPLLRGRGYLCAPLGQRAICDCLSQIPGDALGAAGKPPPRRPHTTAPCEHGALSLEIPRPTSALFEFAATTSSVIRKGRLDLRSRLRDRLN